MFSTCREHNIVIRTITITIATTTTKHSSHIIRNAFIIRHTTTTTVITTVMIINIQRSNTSIIFLIFLLNALIALITQYLTRCFLTPRFTERMNMTTTTVVVVTLITNFTCRGIHRTLHSIIVLPFHNLFFRGLCFNADIRRHFAR